MMTKVGLYAVLRVGTILADRTSTTHAAALFYLGSRDARLAAHWDARGEAPRAHRELCRCGFHGYPARGLGLRIEALTAPVIVLPDRARC